MAHEIQRFFRDDFRVDLLKLPENMVVVKFLIMFDLMVEEVAMVVEYIVVLEFLEFVLLELDFMVLDLMELELLVWNSMVLDLLILDLIVLNLKVLDLVDFIVFNPKG